MQRLACKGVRMWSVWQPDRGMFFNSYFIERAQGNVVVDPLPLSDEDAGEARAAGGISIVVLTNRDHERAAEQLRERFGARIVAGVREAASFEIGIDRTLRDGEEIAAGIVAIELPHGKTPGEIALHVPDANAAIVGDALIGAPAGALSILPDEKLADPEAFVLSLRRLWGLRLSVLLLGDGAPLLCGADEAIGTLLFARAGLACNRINLDELTWTHDASPGGRFSGLEAEVGDPIGARKLGYRLAIVAPGATYCPLHCHDQEEELFFVLEGSPTIRGLHGSIQCRAGDFVAFPTGDRGTHQLLNQSDQPAKLLLLGMERPGDEVVYYPDSDKISVASRALRVRGSPALAYFDGEE